MNVYERITERIIALLAQGTVPWHKPWKARSGWPRNFVTRKPYRGINVFLLVALSYESPFWLTFRQALQLGGNVRKGEKSCPVIFWKQTTREDKESGEPQRKLLLRHYQVFNVAQCDGLKPAPAPEAPPVEVLGQPEEIVTHMPQRPVIRHGMTRAYYSPQEDYVGLPAPERFTRVEDYYSTLFHELVHATGHASRLKRPTVTELAGFGSDPYCKEELIAELGAAFLCGHAEIAERTLDNSAAYLAGWLERLRRDKTLMVQAAAHAQKAADFILGHGATEAETTAPTSAMQLNDAGSHAYSAKEFKVVALRECPLPEQMEICDTPEKAVDYWRLNIATNPYFNPECECFVVLMLNNRRRVKGHQLLTIGTMDTLLVHPREVFRCAIIQAAAAIVVMHNHPSGEPAPSEADIKVTRDLMRAGQLLKIELLDHVIIGNPAHASLRALGYLST